MVSVPVASGHSVILSVRQREREKEICIYSNDVVKLCPLHWPNLFFPSFLRSVICNSHSCLLTFFWPSSVYFSFTFDFFLSSLSSYLSEILSLPLPLSFTLSMFPTHVCDAFWSLTVTGVKISRRENFSFLPVSLGVLFVSFLSLSILMSFF